MTNTWEIFEQILFLEIHMVGQIQKIQIHIRAKIQIHIRGKVQILQIQIAQIQILGEIRIQTQIEIRYKYT